MLQKTKEILSQIFIYSGGVKINKFTNAQFDIPANRKMLFIGHSTYGIMNLYAR